MDQIFSQLQAYLDNGTNLVVLALVLAVLYKFRLRIMGFLKNTTEGPPTPATHPPVTPATTRTTPTPTKENPQPLDLNLEAAWIKRHAALLEANHEGEAAKALQDVVWPALARVGAGTHPPTARATKTTK